MDPRLTGAEAYERQHRWLERCIDELVIESRYALRQARRLRDELDREQEARQYQAEADADLERRPRGRRAA